jgi:hypothetical protein
VYRAARGIKGLNRAAHDNLTARRGADTFRGVLPDQVFDYYSTRGPSKSGRVNCARALERVPQTCNAWAAVGYVPWSAQLELQQITGGGLVARKADLPRFLGGELASEKPSGATALA